MLLVIAVLKDFGGNIRPKMTHSCSFHKLIFELIQFITKHFIQLLQFTYFDANLSIGSSAGQSFSTMICSIKVTSAAARYNTCNPIM